MYGGLGNQLFQYTAASFISLKLGVPFVIDGSWFKFNRLNTKRNSDIEKFSIPHSIMKSKSYLEYFISHMDKRFRFKYLSSNYICEVDRVDVFSSLRCDINHDILLDGYWADYRIVESVLPFIKPYLKLREEQLDISEETKDYLQLIEDTNSVSLHIRRGDYAENFKTNKFHGLIDLSYYVKAIEFISRNLLNPCFFIFSDDIEWCKLNLNFIPNAIFIENSHHSVIDLHIMSRCKSNIIANSTFSWWAATLNENPNKIVIAPIKWFALSAPNNLQLIPSTWKLF